MSPTKKNATKAKDARTKARKELGDLPAKLADVAKLTGQSLIDRYTEVVGTAPKSKNQHFLRKRIAIELQTGGLSPEKKARLKDVQEYALKHKLWPDIRAGETREKKAAPAPASTTGTITRDPRLPAVGTVLEKQHGNVTHKVIVRADGFEYRGETHRSLSKVARLITGTTWNGFLFFGLAERKPAGK